MKQRVDLLNLMLFIFSPFLAIPSIIYGVINKSKFSLLLLILMFGLVSYMYVPNFEDDKARYFEIYENYRDGSFMEMFTYFFLSSQDFILQTLFYVASQIDLPAQLVFSTVTIITISFIFFIYYKIINSFENNLKLGLLSFILLICSISYLDLLSGTRFMFATSFVLLSFYLGLVGKKKWPFLLLFVAIFIHFSTLIFIPVYFALKFLPDKNKIFRLIFIISLIFLILPKSFAISLFEMLGLGGALQEKGKVYLDGNDFMEEGLGDSFGTIVIFYVSILWIFMGYLYLFLTFKRENLFRNMVFLVGALINIFYATPTIFLRYAIVLKLLFVFMLIYELYRYKKSKAVNIFCIIFSMILTTQIIVTRNNIEKSFMNRDSLLLITIIDKEKMTPDDFIY
ncbi:EpsG family protein [uncultured Flavobacterium sp.]|uniref:EpsG family protein n=1 Tax=uncultured Flavobacterium sp. TaxID=165435 RepID=UPI0011FC38A8|nr:EpsG family protein [uncultured Flavobacterium sp.]THD31520.1 MAG: hypothetical protein DI588_12230 [Flavobacterium johnsoniae]